jgi:hypothetical protein
MEKVAINRKKIQGIRCDVAEIHDVTPEYVDAVLRGSRENASIVATYEMLVYGKEKLVEAVKKTRKRR